MKYKTFPCEYKIEGSDGRTLTGYASTFGPPADSVGDIVDKGAFKKTIREGGPPRSKNIKMLWMHQFPLGMPAVLKEDDTGLYFEGRVSETSFGDDCLTYVRDDVVDKMSIGYRTIKEFFDDDAEINHLKEVKLIEISPVPFPANEMTSITGVKANVDPAAVARSLIEQLGLEKNNGGVYAPPEDKGATPFKNFPLAGRDRQWDASAAEKRVRAWADAGEEPNTKYKSAFLWYDSANAENFGAYKLLIADVVDGELVAVPRGVFAAAGAMRGARGGVDVPDDDRPKIRSNIEKYYAKMRREWDDFDERAPWEDEASDDGTGVDRAIHVLQDTIEELSKLRDGEPEPTTPPEPKSGDPVDQSLIEKAQRINALFKGEENAG